VLCGFAAGGRAGKASLPRTGPLLAGLELGGVGRAEPGAEFAADVAEATQGTVLTLVLVVFCGRPDAGGKPGKGLFIVADAIEGEATGDAEPHDRVCETVDRLDCAVLDFNFKTRLLLTVPPLLPLPEELTAQFNGIELPLLPLAAGREG